MKIHQDITYINWVRSTTQNTEILSKIDTFDNIWPRQFLIKLLYFFEDKLCRDVATNIRFYLKIED